VEFRVFFVDLRVTKSLFAALLLLLAGETVIADTIHVEKNTKISAISDAIAKSAIGDIIVVQPGFYQEGNIIITKKLTLIGVDYPVVDGSDSTEVFTILADSVSIKGLQIQNCGVSYVREMAGIRVEQHSHCLLENNKLMHTFFGIYLKNAKDCLVRNNYIEGEAVDEFSSGNAIHLWYCNNITVEGNTCLQHRDGIYLEFTENSNIIRNKSERNLRYGLHFMFSNHDNYIGNQFRDNGAGVAVMFSHHITMYENLFEKNWGSSAYGLLLKDISDGEIKKNIFTENTIGIYGDGANRIKIEANQFSSNGWALKILGSCSGNFISGNNFLANTFDVFTNTSVSNNTFTGNFWSDYTGYDLDRDNIGDVPYRPVKLFTYVTSQVPVAIILLHSPFVDLVNFAEKVIPSLSTKGLEDGSPLMKEIRLQ
jgi:nitrous oxidase accessory protein